MRHGMAYRSYRCSSPTRGEHPRWGAGTGTPSVVGENRPRLALLDQICRQSAQKRTPKLSIGMTGSPEVYRTCSLK